MVCVLCLLRWPGIETRFIEIAKCELLLANQNRLDTLKNRMDENEEWRQNILVFPDVVSVFEEVDAFRFKKSLIAFDDSLYQWIHSNAAAFFLKVRAFFVLSFFSLFIQSPAFPLPFLLFPFFSKRFYYYPLPSARSHRPPPPTPPPILFISEVVARLKLWLEWQNKLPLLSKRKNRITFFFICNILVGMFLN